MIKYDGAPLPDNNGIVSVGNSKVDLSNAKSIYIDDYGNVVVEGHNLPTFASASMTHDYIQLLAGFNPHMLEVIENVFVDTTTVNLIYVDKTSVGYDVIIVLNDNSMLKLREFNEVYSAFEFKNKIDSKLQANTTASS